MKKIIIAFFYCCIFVCFISCKKKQKLSPIPYVKWVKNGKNGLKVSKEMKELEFSVQYKPIDFIIAMEERTPNIDKAKYEQRKTELEDSTQYYDLRISTINPNKRVLDFNISSEQEYMQRIAYMSFDMQKNIYLLEGQDTLSCNLYHFVRSHNLAPYVDFTLAFEKKETTKNKDKTLVYDDQLFGLGIIKLQIDAKDINQIALMKTK